MRIFSLSNFSNADASEFRECERIVDLLSRAGLATRIEAGCSDEGDPWHLILTESTSEPLYHFARLDGFYIVGDPEGSLVFRDRDLKNVIDFILNSEEFRSHLKRCQLPSAALLFGSIVTEYLTVTSSVFLSDATLHVQLDGNFFANSGSFSINNRTHLSTTLPANANPAADLNFSRFASLDTSPTSLARNAEDGSSIEVETGRSPFFDCAIERDGAVAVLGLPADVSDNSMSFA